MDIATVEKNRFEYDFEKAKPAYERSKEKFDEETSKAITVFMDSFGLSARSIMRQFLDAEKFKAA
jgi:hypothetical protein